MEQNLIDSTYELIDDIKQLDIYKKFVELNKKINSSTEIKVLVEEFKKYEAKYEEVSKYGKYHPDLQKVRQEFSITKNNLYTNDIVKEYKKLEKEIQSLLNNISKEIANAVSTQIKHPNEIGLIPKH